jgi:hypothetical protein
MDGTGDGLSAAIAGRVDRWTRFLDGSGPTRLFVIRYAPGADTGDRPWPNPPARQRRLDWMRASYEWHLARAEWLDDDTIPCLDLFTGTELFAESFGCPVHRPADNNPFALPLVRTAAEADGLAVPSLDAEPLVRVFDLADEMRRWAGPGAVMRLPDLQTPLDIAALIWEKQGFYTALLEDPAAVERLAAKVRTLEFAFLDEWFRRYGRPAVAHFPDYLLPRGVSLSADEVGALCPAMFDRFVLPELSAFSGRYGGIGIHCCAHARHQWEGFARVPGLMLLNLHQGEPVLRDAYGRFAPVTAQWHFCSDPSAAHRPRETDLPRGARLVIEAAASSRDEALALSEVHHVID